MATQQTFAFLAGPDTERDFDHSSSASLAADLGRRPPLRGSAFGKGSVGIGPAAEAALPAATASDLPRREPEATRRHDLQAEEAQRTKTQRTKTQRTKTQRTKTTGSPDHESILQKLRRQAACISTAPVDDAKVMSTGSPPIDSRLPRGGLRLDAVNEWVSASNCSGAEVLSMIALSAHFRAGENRFEASGPLVVVDREGVFYPPAAVALGVPADRIILVRPRNHADHVWAIDQALRCESVAAVWSAVGSRLDDRDARRFQLSAESGETPGFFVRPATVRGRPTFADVRFYSEPAARAAGAGVQPSGCAGQAETWAPTTRTARLTLQVTIDRCRGGTTGQSVRVEINDRGQLEHHETFAMHLASRLAHPKVAQSPANARDDSRRRRA